MTSAYFSLAIGGTRLVEITLNIAQTATVEDNVNPLIYFNCQ